MPPFTVVVPVRVLAPAKVSVPLPDFVTLPVPEMAEDNVLMAAALLRFRDSAPALASAPLPVMPPVPAEVSVRPLVAPEFVIPALTLIAPAALSVSVVLALQVSALATVMSPASVPLAPVATVTFALASAFCSVVALIVAPLPVAVKPEALASALVEMVIL